jgi:predicted hydrocarbon binding protein
MTYAEVFGFGFSRYYIPTMKGLRDRLGEDGLVEMLKGVSMDVGRRLGEQYAGEIGSSDLAAFTHWAKEPSRLYENVLEWEIVEDTESTVAVKITECLWAKTFRDAQAADIGYAGICHGDFGAAPGFNPKMHLERTKTLMQGHDCCDHRWVVEE